MKYTFLITLFSITTIMLQAQTQKTTQPDELGTVDWIRNFDNGLAKAKKENKPIFLLFQEVPGCATCRNYGHNVLSHPLIAEAIETLFVPVAIYNNKGGSDAKVLKYYNEPTWNNPVVRIVGFWTGEKSLGKLDGVVATQPGFMSGREVVQVEYDPKRIDFETVLRKANRSGCADKVYAENSEQMNASKNIVGDSGVTEKGNFRLDREPKYYLSKTVYQYIPMTQIQAAKANSLIGRGQLPNEVLSPRQIELVEQIRTKKKVKWKSAINVDIQEAWEEVEELL